MRSVMALVPGTRLLRAQRVLRWQRPRAGMKLSSSAREVRIRSLRSFSSVVKNPDNIEKSSYSPSSSGEMGFGDGKKPDFLKEGESKYFEFDHLEKDIYTWWEQSGYFKPSEDTTKESYVLPMPPPNVTGYLHMGHAMFIALQDILARFHRMRGKATLWLPGTDHAGIATQMLVERALVEEGTSRTGLGREKFLQRIWDWKAEKGGYIQGQMKRLGASADWSREKFTLEPQMSASVTEAFVRMHDKGLIYKGDYMVNWSPNLQTAVSDLEVDYVEEEGCLYYFKYEVADGSGEHIPVATTRPETILGDTAVCVHPEDERYKHMIGKDVLVPVLGRKIPVIADDYVDRKFGTGALKITPAHDPNDYEIGKRHGLEMINIMNKDASINEVGGAKYANLDRFECRSKLWEDMEALGLVIKAEAHMQRVPRSQRGGEVIEPMISTQWFLKMENMANRALDAVESGDVRIIPDRFEKTWHNWLDNIHDWCISRQLWWGHRIPVYYASLSDGTEHEEYFVARTEAEARVKAQTALKTADFTLRQDDDVLDTWFSSGLWPFATVGWPAQTTEYERFYPAACLETGYDILFFWVARMVMMGLELTDKSPFHTIYMHGLVRSGDGQKMSKTKGNVIDPLDTIQTYGCDALRYSLVTGSSPGQDIPLSMERIEANRNFANKLWNVGKYLQNALKDVSEDELSSFANSAPMSEAELASLPFAERYIISRCHGVVDDVTESLEKYEFGAPGRRIYEFLWDEFADWYIEASKARMRDPAQGRAVRRALTYVWSRCISLLHPFMPFLTEVLWQLQPHSGESIMVAPWPKMTNEPSARDADAERKFDSLQNVVRAIRNARADYNVQPGKKIAANLVVSADLMPELSNEAEAIALLARVDPTLLTISTKAPSKSADEAVHLVVEDGLEAFLPMADFVDKEKETERLTRQAEKIAKDVAVLEGRLGSKGFVEKAPAEKVDKVRVDLAEKKEQLATVVKSLEDLNL